MSPLKRYSATLAIVHDGDTISVHENGRVHKCRLAWLDAPEYGQAYATEARAELFHMLKGHAINIAVLRYDKYHREIVAIRTDHGLEVNAQLIARGLAWYCPRFGRGPRQLPELEAQAKFLQRGLWKNPHPTPPWTYRGTLAATHTRRPARTGSFRNPERAPNPESGKTSPASSAPRQANQDKHEAGSAARNTQPPRPNAHPRQPPCTAP